MSNGADEMIFLADLVSVFHIFSTKLCVYLYGLAFELDS